MAWSCRCGGVNDHVDNCPEVAQQAYDPTEQDVILAEFMAQLKLATKDGGAKRARGEKPPWWRDRGHIAAIYSHWAKWLRGELVDNDSGAHPLVHLAWRALAVAVQETKGMVDPMTRV